MQMQMRCDTLLQPLSAVVCLSRASVLRRAPLVIESVLLLMRVSRMERNGTKRNAQHSRLTGATELHKKSEARARAQLSAFEEEGDGETMFHAPMCTADVYNS